MSNVRVAIAGAAGRMGQRLVALTEETPGLSFVKGWEAPGTSVDGGGVLASTMQDAITGADVYIDFTRPTPTLEHLEIATSAGIAAVVGTTGFDRPVPELFADFSSKIPIVWAPNMSVGVNLLRKLVEDAVKALGPDYDSEIVEMHHRWKEDAPSGTAKALLRAVQAGRGTPGNVITGREGITGQRTADDIGVMTLRGGDVVGDHTVYLAGLGERLELTHRASSRDTFAHGALRAAAWIVEQPPGLYDMFDVLGW